jgi:hypothetical protein
MIFDADDDGWRDKYDWTAWFDPVKASNRVVIKPLCSALELQEEGAVMHHCAGRYYLDCMTGTTQIFSLRTEHGKRLSTLQLQALRAGRGKYRFSEVQHRAACNASPPDVSITAAKDLLSALNTGELAHRVGRLRPRQMNVDSRALCGFDYRCDEAWQRVRAATLPFLPSDLRRLDAMDLGAFVTAFKLQRRSEQPELNEPDDDHEDFEKRVLRWIR